MWTGILCMAPLQAEKKLPPLRTVDFVDIQRYLGKWYEIARYPNRFQRGCLDSTATYSLRSDGRISVVNECRREGGKNSNRRVRGKAWVVDKKSNARLKVQFFWPFIGDYWVIQLGENYEYAVVGEPKRRFLWILSRRPVMDESLYQTIAKKIDSQGYKSTRLIRNRASETK